MKIYIVQWFIDNDPIKIFFSKKDAYDFFYNILYKKEQRHYYSKSGGWTYGKEFNRNIRARILEFHNRDIKVKLLFGFDSYDEKLEFNVIIKSLRRKLCKIYY